MSCWTHITGLIELDVIKLHNIEEIDKYYQNTIKDILIKECNKVENRLEWSEGILVPEVITRWNSIYLVYRDNLRDFWEKLTEKEEWETDYSKFYDWIELTINNLNKIFNYEIFNIEIERIYEKIDNTKEYIDLLEIEKKNDNWNHRKIENMREKIIIDIIKNDYNWKLPIYATINNLLFQWFNSYNDTINFNLMNSTLTIMENNKVIETRKIIE